MVQSVSKKPRSKGQVKMKLKLFGALLLPALVVGKISSSDVEFL
jgi:hypothetical protein